MVRSCPLCGGALDDATSGPTVLYGAHSFGYRPCRQCSSLICDPMPDEGLLSQMYGVGYGDFEQQFDIVSALDREWVIRRLDALPVGSFVDFGSGQGEVLQAAAEAGWDVVGVEYDPAVAAATSGRLGVPVVPASEAPGLAGRFDVVHLGDVIEHLTDVEVGLSLALRLLRPRGVVLAQGPLEANASLFTAVLRCSQHLRPTRAVSMAPYHVIQATAEGQRRAFDRSGLCEESFEVFEVDWPAPSRLHLRDCLRGRAVSLFLLRRLSRRVSSARRAWGNRYRFVGRLETSWPAEGPPA